jgi:predicted molibdopterin-dependent oxidoreductase YjgC
MPAERGGGLMAEAGVVNLTIEGRAVSVPAGTSILEAAKFAGVLIPHYCYHPSLPIAGVCRMCLVEVEKAPKLAPACATAAGEGQVVHVYSPAALEARKGVLEFLLINHPLDCPICDQAGECELQDRSRSDSPRRRISAATSCTSPTAASSARAAFASWRTWRTTTC